MSTTIYTNPLGPFAEYTSGPFHDEVRQWFLDNPQNDSDYESFNGWGGYNPEYHTQEMYGEIGKQNRGRKHTEETKEKLSKIDRSYMKTDSYRQNMSKALKGNTPWNKGKTSIYTEETLKKMSDAHKGKKVSEKARKKMSEAGKGKVFTEEHKKKLASALRKYHETKRNTP